MLTATDPRTNVFVTNVYDAEKRWCPPAGRQGRSDHLYYDTSTSGPRSPIPDETSYHFYDEQAASDPEQNPLGTPSRTRTIPPGTGKR